MLASEPFLNGSHLLQGLFRNVGKLFSEPWQLMLASTWKAKEHHQRDGADSARLLRSISWSIQWRVFLYSVLHGWSFLFFMTIDPLMLRVLLKAVQDAGEHSVESISLVTQFLLVGALSLSMLFRVTCMEICFFASLRVQNNVRSVLVHSIFRKSLWIPDHALDVGKIANLMATDADKIGKWSALLFQLSQWSWTFLSLPVLAYFLYGLVGSAAFVGLAMIILGATTSRSLGLCLQHYSRIVQTCRDHRSGLMSEMVRGIRTVKLQAGLDTNIFKKTSLGLWKHLIFNGNFQWERENLFNLAKS